MMLPPTCKTCRWFNFKVSVTHAWGECLNPVVGDAQMVRYVPTHIDLSTEELKKLLNDVRAYARIYYREDEFGCRFHAPDGEMEG